MMNSIRFFLTLTYFFSSLFFSSESSWAQEKTRLKKVTLLGQPCSLEGPRKYTEATLFQIHEMGPDQIYPVTTISHPKKLQEELKNDLNKLKLLKAPLKEFQLYIEKFKKKLIAQLLFIQHIPSFSAASSLTLKNELSEEMYQTLKPILNQVTSLNPSGKNYNEALEQLFESFNEKLDLKTEWNPEKEYHKVLRNLEIEYSCTLDGSDSSKNE